MKGIGKKGEQKSTWKKIKITIQAKTWVDCHGYLKYLKNFKFENLAH